MNAMRRLSGWVTKSPERAAWVASVFIGAVLFGIGLGVFVNAVRQPEVGLAPSATAVATPGASASASATPNEDPWLPTVSPTPSPEPTVAAKQPVAPTPASTPPPDPTQTPMPTPLPTATPTPLAGGCATVTADASGTIFVDGTRVDDPWGAEYGEQMPMAVLRLAAGAAGVSGATACLEVALPDVIVTGSIEICGDVLATRFEPEPTPIPAEPGPTMPPRYGEPTIAGVAISDRMLDINSYPLLDIADVVDAPACLHVQAASNDVHTTLSLAICESVRLAEDGTLTVFVGDREWPFAVDYVYDENGVLPVGETVSLGLDVRNFKDDVRHLIEMAVWAHPGCPWDR